MESSFRERMAYIQRKQGLYFAAVISVVFCPTAWIGPKAALHLGHCQEAPSEAISANCASGIAGSKQIRRGVIVFPRELRMYLQRHLTWRKTLRKVNRQRNLNTQTKRTKS
jgi:hypothetical protein